MALSFIGKPISLISHSDVRYRGILAGIDPAASTIQLSNVYSMGTETRRPPAEFIPPVQEPYQYIIFRASEVKDLAVDEPAPRRSVHDDPAVLGASAPVTQPAYSPYNAVPPQAPVNPQAQAQVLAPQPPQTYPNRSTPAQPQVGQQQPAPVASNQNANAQHQQQQQPSQQQQRRNNSVHTAAASLETVERALGDLRVSNNTIQQASGGRGSRRGAGAGGREGAAAKELKVPTTDFDFQSSNAKFDKAALAPKKRDEDEDTNPSDQEKDSAGKDAGNGSASKAEPAYNPQKSFFDSLSSSTHPPAGGARGGRRGGAAGRNRREEERERNVATFGEPGGVGLMGPGAYVGGWGGYGRRSGPGSGAGERSGGSSSGRGRRGAAPVSGR